MTLQETQKLKLHAKRKRSTRSVFGAIPFLLPALLFYGVFVLYPMLNALRLSFFEWNGFSGSALVPVGLENYVFVLSKDPVFWTAVRNSLIWVILSLMVPTTLGLVLALALHQKIPGRNTFRIIFYLPAILAPIAVATMWRWMYNPNFGVINSVLKTLGLASLKQAWLGDPDIALYSIFVASVWVITGLNMVVFLAGLQNVPEDQMEAARVDGAGTLAVFRHVTIPSLRPSFIVVFVFTFINSLKVFDLIVGMTNGGPAQSTQVLALWSYTQSFVNHNFGEGNAIGTLLLVLSLMIVIPYLSWVLREDGE